MRMILLTIQKNIARRSAEHRSMLDLKRSRLTSIKTYHLDLLIQNSIGNFISSNESDDSFMSRMCQRKKLLIVKIGVFLFSLVNFMNLTDHTILLSTFCYVEHGIRDSE